MNETVIAFYSDRKENLKQLLSALSKCVNSSVKEFGFNSNTEIIQFLQQNTFREKIQIVILDINYSGKDTIQFIEAVNRASSDTLKLIFSDSNSLLKIQDYFKNKDSFYFLNRTWSETDFRIVLNSVNVSYSNLQILSKHKSDVSGYSKKPEEQVSTLLKELSESNMAKDKFFSIIAHDLKSPFTALLGISEILISEWDEIADKEKLELVKGLKSSSENTYKLLENLLIWSKTQMEKMVAIPGQVQINEVINAAIEICNSNASQKQIRIVNSITEDVQVYVDKNMISTVFRNLLSNAVKYIQPGGEIIISLTVGKTFFTFCVSDNGAGIFQSNVIDYFKPGSKISINSSITNFKGIGLLLCKDFIECNGGQIWLETERGKGSKFFFTIPQL